MNVLITGANGFIGKHLTIEQLKKGHDVYAIVTSKEEMKDIESPRLHVFCLFFEDYDSISKIINSKIDIAYHLAWAGLSGQSAKDVLLQLNNVKALFVLLNELKKLSIKKFVFSSTMNSIEVRNMLEDPQNYKTRGVYIHVASKINAEIVARTFCEENGIEYNEAVIAMAYGENNKSKMIVNVFIYSLLNDIEPKLVSGNNKYDIVYVKDIINALDCIGMKGINKKSYYVGHCWNKTFKEIFLEIKDIVNPSAHISFGTFPDDNKINFDSINRTALQLDTGWTIEDNISDSIKKTMKWIKESGIKFA